MDLFKTIDPDFGEDYSDEGISAESSEDEIDIILHGTPEQKRKLYKRSNKRANSSSEDDFEKEMNEELQQTVNALESRRLSESLDESDQKDDITDKSQKEQKSDIQKFYDDIYFDSDDEVDEKGSEKKKKDKQPFLSNDDLLYDPKMDDEDQKWVDNKRKECQPRSSTSDTGNNKLPRTDAILNCPACMTTLCRDCQRHEKYSNQYRAMFVSNCQVIVSETLKYPKEETGKKKKKKKKDNPVDTKDTDNSDVFHPVKCTECETVVAVYDKEEIYYFFNVLSSYS